MFSHNSSVICLLFPRHASGWRHASTEVIGAACEWSRLLVLLRGMWQRNGAVFTADPGPSVKKRGASGKRAGDAQRDGRNTASTSSSAGALAPLNMEKNYPLCGINWLDANVAGQWVRQSVQAEHLAHNLSVLFLTVATQHLQWCGLRSGGEPSQLFSAFWDTLRHECWPKRYKRTRLLKVRMSYYASHWLCSIKLRVSRLFWVASEWLLARSDADVNPKWS